MRPVSRVLVTVCAAGAAALGPTVVAQAAASASITTGPTAEAWYRTAPVCMLPTGCPAQPPSPYAPQTLHIGVNLGQEEARSALQLDLSALPAGTKVAGGQLRLPVANGPQDGTSSAESAKMRACLVDEPVQDADGSFDAAPEVDCDTASASAVFVAGTEQAPATFTVDLSAIALAWEDSAAAGALALVPAEDVAPPDTWHVALSNRNRQGENIAKITAALSYVSVVFDTEQEPPPLEAPFDTGFSLSTGVDSTFESYVAPGPTLDAPMALSATPEVADPAPRAVPAPVPVASVLDASFRYPAVFLLPLLFAVGAAWLGRALTCDLATT